MNSSKLKLNSVACSNPEIEAAKVILTKLKYECNLLDHFYSGDKDTFKEAYDNVLSNLGVIQKDHTVYIDEDLFVLYELEIKKEFDELVEFGKKEIQARQMFIDYLNKLIKTTDE